MSEYRYILEPYKGKDTRHDCPSCGNKKQFARYIDTETGQYLANDVGRCNRLNECGHHKTPKDYFNTNGIKTDFRRSSPKPPPPPVPISYIEEAYFMSTLKTPLENNLLKYLLSIFDIELVDELLEMYYIGTSEHWSGGTTIFWQLDEKENIRTGKLIKYNETTGKRLKKPFIHTNWIHSILKLENYNLKQCFFGAHLIDRPENKSKIIGIVESEKTAIISAGHFPNMIWLASGSAEGINEYKLRALKGRKVILYPDTSKDIKMFNKWEQKALQYNLDISTYLEDNTTDEEKAEGLDIADFLTKQTLIKVDKEPETEPEVIGYAVPSGEIPSLIIDEIEGEIPYFNSPSYTIDKSIKNAPIFKGNGLVIKNRVFNNIEIISTTNFGRCESKGHKWEGICPYCMYNCIHAIKIKGEVQSRKYSQLEILIMQNQELEPIQLKAKNNQNKLVLT